MGQCRGAIGPQAVSGHRGRAGGRVVAGALGAAGGLAMAASLPPWPVATGTWWLGPVGVALAFTALVGRRWIGRLEVGLVSGLALYGPGLVWMRDFDTAGYLAAVVVEVLILAMGLALVPLGPTTDGSRQPVSSGAVAFPAVLVLVDLARSLWPFGGLPLAGLGLSQMAGPLAPVARLGGSAALVGVVGMAGVGLALVASQGPSDPVGWVVRSRLGQRVGALVLLVVVVGLAAGGAAASDGRALGRVRVAIVQGGGLRGFRAVDTDEAVAFEAHRRASQEVTAPVDLVLWPEDVIDVEVLAGSDEDEALSALARRLEASVVAGVVANEGDCPKSDGGVCRFTNAAVVWGPDGVRGDRTDKVHRVPFGEYVPYRDLFSRLGDVSAVPRDAIAGVGPGLLRTSAGPVGVLISFEVFFGDRAAAGVDAGGQVILVPTNASSFRGSQVPAQQLAAARMRAVETGRWVLQASPTGYSAVIDPRGRVLQRSGLGRAQVLIAIAQKRTGRTPAVAGGNWWFVGLAAAGLLGAGICRRKGEWNRSRSAG